MPRGSAPGERRGGRKKGTPNNIKKTAGGDIRSVASLHARQAIEHIVRLMTKGRNEQVRIAAAKEILDRAYGRPTQTLAGDKDNPIFPNRIEVTLVGPPG